MARKKRGIAKKGRRRRKTEAGEESAAHKGISALQGVIGKKGVEWTVARVIKKPRCGDLIGLNTRPVREGRNDSQFATNKNRRL